MKPLALTGGGRFVGPWLSVSDGGRAFIMWPGDALIAVKMSSGMVGRWAPSVGGGAFAPRAGGGACVGAPRAAAWASSPCSRRAGCEVPTGAPGPAAGWGGVSWLLLAGCIAAWRRWLPLEAPPTEEALLAGGRTNSVCFIDIARSCDRSLARSKSLRSPRLKEISRAQRPCHSSAPSSVSLGAGGE